MLRLLHTSPGLVSYDRALRIEATADSTSNVVSLDRTGAVLLELGFAGACWRDARTLRTIRQRSLGPSGPLWELAGNGAMLAPSEDGSWIGVSYSGRVIRIGADAERAEVVAKLPGAVGAAAFDAISRTVFVTRGDNLVDAVSVHEGGAIREVAIPCGELRNHIVLAGGLVWVVSDEGGGTVYGLTPADLEVREIQKWDVGANTRVAASNSGRLLAIYGARRAPEGGWECRVVVRAVGNGEDATVDDSTFTVSTQPLGIQVFDSPPGVFVLGCSTLWRRLEMGAPDSADRAVRAGVAE